MVLLKLLNSLEFSDNNRLNRGFQHKPQTFPLKSICQNIYEKTSEIHYTLYNLVKTSVLSVASVTVKYYMFRLQMNYLRSWFSFVKQNKHPGEWKTRHIITQYLPRVSIFRVISTCILKSRSLYIFLNKWRFVVEEDISSEMCFLSSRVFIVHCRLSHAGGVRHDPQRFMGKTVTVPHFNRETVEFASRKRNESNPGIKTLLPFPKTITEESDFENFQDLIVALDACYWFHKAISRSLSRFGDDRAI